MTEPLWQNEQWMILEDGIYHRVGDFVDFFKRRDFIEAEPDVEFKKMIVRWKFDPIPLYDTFLQLATYWDLKNCNYDELRKIRDEAKETAQ